MTHHETNTACSIVESIGMRHISWSGAGQMGRVAIEGDVYVERLDLHAAARGLEHLWTEVCRRSPICNYPIRVMAEDGTLIQAIGDSHHLDHLALRHLTQIRP